MNEIKDKLDKIEYPETTLTPIGILQNSLAAKKRKQRKDAILFHALILVLGTLLYTIIVINVKWFLWVQIPIVTIAIIVLGRKLLIDAKRGENYGS